MIALIVEINIKPGFKEQFMASMLGDARGSNNDEPGCLRFDVLQDNEDENKLHLFEVYEDDAALDAHRNAPISSSGVRNARTGSPPRTSARSLRGLSRPRAVGKAPSGGLNTETRLRTRRGRFETCPCLCCALSY